MMQMGDAGVVGGPFTHHEGRCIARHLTAQGVNWLSRRGHFGGVQCERPQDGRLLRCGPFGRGSRQRQLGFFAEITSCGGGRIACDRDPEPPQPARVVPFKQQIELQRGRRFERFLETEHGRVPAPLGTIDRPAGERVSVDRFGSRTRAGRERLARVLQSDRLPIGGELHFRQEEVANRPFVVNVPRPALRQAVVGDRLDSKRGHSAKVTCKVEVIQVTLRLITRGQHRAIVENREQGQAAGGFGGREWFPPNGSSRLLLRPAGQRHIPRLAATLCQRLFGRNLAGQGHRNFSQQVVRSKILFEPNRECHRARAQSRNRCQRLGRWRQGERAIDVPWRGTINRPTGRRVAVDCSRCRKILLRKICRRCESERGLARRITLRGDRG